MNHGLKAGGLINDMKNINKFKRLIIKDCANHFIEQGSINHYCCMIDGVCLFFENKENERCGYFEEGVLPLDGVLERGYYTEIDVKPIKEQGDKPKPRIKCKNCGKNIQANSNR
ncbi:hypothetical protein [Clostridium pasteurianum]|nr:hypothetical protein [Clostridium pasteurianum]